MPQSKTSVAKRPNLKDALSWIEGVSTCVKLPPQAARVAGLVSVMAIREGGPISPSAPDLAVALGVKHDTVRDALTALRDQGFIDIVIRRGRGHTNTYSLNIPPRQIGGEA